MKFINLAFLLVFLAGCTSDQDKLINYREEFNKAIAENLIERKLKRSIRYRNDKIDHEILTRYENYEKHRINFSYLSEFSCRDFDSSDASTLVGGRTEEEKRLLIVCTGSVVYHDEDRNIDFTTIKPSKFIFEPFYDAKDDKFWWSINSMNFYIFEQEGGIEMLRKNIISDLRDGQPPIRNVENNNDDGLPPLSSTPLRQGPGGQGNP